MNDLSKLYIIDILQHICSKLDLKSLDNMREVSKDIFSILDDQFYKQIADDLWGKEFWEKAMQRSASLSQPLQTWRQELIRLELFQRMIEKHEKKRWNKEQFYTVWSREPKI